MEQPREMTTKQDREQGVRRFGVMMGAHQAIEVEVKVVQYRDQALPDEEIRLEGKQEPVSNRDLAIAMVKITALVAGKVGNRA